MAIELNVVVTTPELETAVVVPDLTTSVKIPGVAPDTSSLSTNVTTPELTTATTITGLSTAVSENAFTALVPGTVGSEATPTLFVRGLEELNVSNPIYISIRKSFAENIGIIEAFSALLTYNRNFTELVNSSQVFSISTGKTLQEIIAASLAEYKLVQKLVPNVATTQDINFLQVTKRLLDLVTNTSINTLTVTKALTEALTNSEYKQFNIVKLFEDSVDATDDYLGTANLDDDQYAYFGKTLVDYLSTSDIQIYVVGNRQQDTVITADPKYALFTRIVADTTQNAEDISAYFSNVTLQTVVVQETTRLTTSLIKSDQFNFLDQFNIVVNYRRSLLDQVQASEYNLFDISVVKSDTIVINDNFSFAAIFNRTITDTASFIEYSIFNVNKVLLDSSRITDTSILNAGKYLADLSSFADTFTRQVNYLRSFEDILNTTDDYYGAANVDDDQYAQFNKVIADSITSIETKVFQTAKILTDVNTISEQKSISVTKPITDSSNIADSSQITISKTLSDSFANTDITYLNPKIVKSDIFNSSDNLTTFILWDRSFSDQLSGITDTKRFSINLTKRDTVNNSDVLNTAVSFNRSFEDALITSESKYFNVSNLILDTGNIVEAKAVNFTRPVTDNTSNSELLTKQVSYQRTILDTVDATDDYYGAATVGDDEFFSLNKGLVETVLVTESTYFSNSNQLTDLVTNNSTSYYNFTKPNSEQVFSSEQIRKQPNVLLLDVTITSEITYFNTNLIKLDTTTTGEIFSRIVNYTRSYSDTSINIDTVRLTNQLSKQDLVTTSSTDVFSSLVNYVKNYFDTSSTSESLAKVISKFLADVGQTAETRYLQVQKYFADISNKSDTITTTTSYLRSFQDMVDATDDYYGAATVGDDEYAQFNKVVIDSITTSETRYVYATKILSDQATSVDSKAAAVAKTLADILSITAVDYITRGPSKGLQDTTTISETKTFNVGKYLVDLTTTSENKYFNVAKYLAHVATTSEQLTRFVNKALLDSTTSIPESASFSVGKYSADTISKTDTQQSSIQPKQFDTVRFMDVLTFLKSGGYIFTDSIYSTDSGTINNQNYFASSYVTPGYAGTNVNFGT
jgi:hypothetical protein